jgi:GAF domain-containing protein
MLILLKQIFSTQSYSTAARKELARVLYSLAVLLLLGDVIIIAVVPQSQSPVSILMDALQNGITINLLAGTAVAIAAVLTIALVRAGLYDFGAWLLNIIFVVALAASIFSGSLSYFDVTALCITLVLSALTLGRRGLLIVGTSSTLIFIASFYFTNDPTITRISYSGLTAFLVLAAMVYAFMRLADANRTEGRSLESEQRSKLAEINIQITRQASERMSLKSTLDKALNLILENYPQLYHAQVFLISDDGIQAKLVASTGEVGNQLINKGHSLAVGSLSVIGQTTFKGEPVIARSGDLDSVHRRNELLPQTQVEAAFPMQIGNKIIGALDLQSREDLVLSEFDMLSFQSLANSLSLALDSIQQFEAAKASIAENQRLAEQTRTALREVERLNQRLIGRAWSDYLSGQGNRLGLNIDLENNEIENDTTWTTALVNAAQAGTLVQDGQVIAVPLRVRGLVIGAMEFELHAGQEFTPADLELVQEVSERFGLAAENTRLVEESQRIAQRESLINEISTRLQSAINVESTMAEAARSLSDTLQANKVTIRLGAPSAEKLIKSHTNGAKE